MQGHPEFHADTVKLITQLRHDKGIFSENFTTDVMTNLSKKVSWREMTSKKRKKKRKSDIGIIYDIFLYFMYSRKILLR